MNRPLVTVLAALALGGAAFGQADSFMDKVRAKYLAAADYKASVECLRTGADGSTVVSKGSVEMRRPDRFRIEYEKPSAYLMVFDGKILWVHRPKDRTVTSTTIRAAPDLLAWFNPYDQLFPARVIDGAPTNGDFQIWLDIAENRDSLREVKLIVDRKTLLIRGIFATDAAGNAYEYTFTKMKLDAGLKDNRFEFTVPSGSQLIENF